MDRRRSGRRLAGRRSIERDEDSGQESDPNESNRGSRMTTSIAKPKVRHPSLPVNALGLTRRDYEGAMSTLCAGCGHDSVTAAIVRAFWEMDIAPHRVAKLSGIGCSSKTPTYFLREAHGFNSVHGRMKVASEHQPTNRDKVYAYVRERQTAGEVATGLLYLEKGSADMSADEEVIDTPLVDLPYEELCPGSAELDRLMETYR
jgi:hypothetical protein